MLNDVTLGDFEGRSKLVQLREKDTVQTAHCALLGHRLPVLNSPSALGARAG